MNKLTSAQRAQIIVLLCEGNSLRAISRATGISFNTVSKLLVDAGKACLAHHDETVRNVKSKRIQCDEIWAFCYAKKKNVAAAKAAPVGADDIWTWTALDADTKLMVSYYVGERDAPSANAFMQDTASRLANRVQLTTDNLKTYLDAVEDAFGGDIDYATMVRLYGDTVAGGGRYGPAECTSTRRERLMDSPEMKLVNTSCVERSNLTMRMSVRRFNWLTNAIRKKAENHSYAVALHSTHYNFARMHKTLKCSPAMAAGLSNKLWEISDIVALVEAADTPAAKRGTYRPRQKKVAAEISN